MCLFRNKKKAVNPENKIWSESPLSTDSPAERLYKDLWSRRDELSKGFFRTQYDKDEDVAIISEAIYGWWKQRWVVNHKTRRAFEFIDANEHLVNVTTDDIDWESLNGLPDEAIKRAKELYAGYPTQIYGFHNGVSKVEWQLNPDGRYFMDEDGFGMTDDEEIAIYGKIDSNGCVVEKFKYDNR